MRTPFTDPILDIIGELDETQATGAVDSTYKMMAYIKALYSAGIAGRDIFFGTITTGGSATSWAVEGLIGLGDHFFYNSKWYALMVYTTDQAAPIGEWRAVTDYTSATGTFTSAAFSAVTTANDQVYLIPSYIYLAVLSLGNMADAATNSNLSDITTTSVHAKLSRMLTDYTNGRAGYLDELSAANIPADIDTLKTAVGVASATATADTLADIATTDAHAKLGRILLRFSANAFSSTINGAACTDVEAMASGLASYFVAAGAAFSASIGGSARTAIDTALAALDAEIYTAGHTLKTPNTKIGDIARTIDLILGSRWDSSGDLGTDVAALIASLGNSSANMSAVTPSDSASTSAYLSHMHECTRIKTIARIGLIVPDYANIASDTDNAALYSALNLISHPSYIDQTEVDNGEQDWNVYDCLVIGSDKYAAFTTSNMDDLIAMKVPMVVCNSPVAAFLKMGTAAADGDSSVDEYCQSIGNRVTMLQFGSTGDKTIFSPAATSDRLDMSDAQLSEELLMTNLVGDTNTTAVLGWLPVVTSAGVFNTLDDATEMPAGRTFAGCFNNADNLTATGLALFQRVVRNTALSEYLSEIVVNANASKLNDIDTDLGEPNDTMQVDGPSYIQVNAPCITGWTFDAGTMIELSRLAVETGLWPLAEWVNGELASVKKIRRPKPVTDYLEIQGRYKHLFKKNDCGDQLAKIQAIADANKAKYKLVD